MVWLHPFLGKFTPCAKTRKNRKNQALMYAKGPFDLQEKLCHLQALPTAPATLVILAMAGEQMLTHYLKR
jgi:hypothetical protein